jgi:surface antigen
VQELLDMAKIEAWAWLARREGSSWQGRWCPEVDGWRAEQQDFRRQMCGRRNSGDFQSSDWWPAGLHAGNKLDLVPRRWERQLDDGAASRDSFPPALVSAVLQQGSRSATREHEGRNTGSNSSIGSLRSSRTSLTSPATNDSAWLGQGRARGTRSFSPCFARRRLFNIIGTKDRWRREQENWNGRRSRWASMLDRRMFVGPRRPHFSTAMAHGSRISNLRTVGRRRQRTALGCLIGALVGERGAVVRVDEGLRALMLEELRVLGRAASWRRLIWRRTAAGLHGTRLRKKDFRSQDQREKRGHVFIYSRLKPSWNRIRFYYFRN